MARPLPPTNAAPSTSEAGFAGITFLLCAFALFMCASHSRKLRACYDLLDVLDEDDDPVIQHNTEAMMQATGVLGNQLENGGGDSMLISGEQGTSLWQKNILMGGKCQLPDFSGVIIYDSEGNVVTPANNNRPLLTWK